MKVKLKKIYAGVAAAFTTPDAIKREKSFAAFVATRLLLSLGLSAVLVDQIVKLAVG